MERVTFDPVTGEKMPTFGDYVKAQSQGQSAPAEKPAEPPATMPGAGLPTVDSASRERQTVTIDGKEYEMVHLPEGGIRPRGGKRYAIPLAMLGIRSIGKLTGILAGDKVYVLPKGEQ